MPLLFDIDAAVTAHMQHGAMAGADPLTDSLLDQLETCAAEGAQPAAPYAHSRPQPQREHGAWWLLAGTLLATLGGLCFYPWGI